MRKLPVSKQLLLTLWKFRTIFKCVWKPFLIETTIKIVLIIILIFVTMDGIFLQPLKKEGELIIAEDLIIYYSPRGDLQDSLMEKFGDHRRTPNAIVTAVDSEDAMEQLWEEHHDEKPDDKKFAGVIFQSAAEDNLNYTIRLADNARIREIMMHTTDTDQEPWRNYVTVFVAIQMVIDSGYIENLTGQVVDYEEPEVFFWEIELSTVHKTIMLLRFTSFTGLFICVTSFRVIMDEKESGMKEYQNILGIQSIMLWLGRLIDMIMRATLSNAVVAFAVTFVLEVKWAILWMYLTLYSMKAASFLFFMSVLFKRTMTALIFVAILWSATGNFGRFFIIYSYEMKSKTTRYLVSFFFPNAGMALGYYSLVKLERFKAQADPDYIKNEEREFLIIVALMSGSTIFYLLMTFYVDPIWDGATGINWHPLYFRRKYRGRSASPRASVVEVDYVYAGTGDDKRYFEHPPIPTHPVVRMRSVSKSYPSARGRLSVLHEVNMDFYTNEVTVILGENGCGKSTVINTIIGKTVPTNGTVYVESMDVREEYDLSLIRAQIGWCPQTNIFLGCMTVTELLTYAGKLRGLENDDIEEQVSYLIDALSLRPVANKAPGGLYSTRRMIGFAFSVMGRPPILLLDEPATGLDIEGRRLIWKVIKELRRNRVIILATNYIDMVDEIADRVAVLKSGKISCWGSPIFLRTAYDLGFNLQVERSHKVNTSTIKKAILHYIPDAVRRPSQPRLISFRLPSTYKKRLPRLLRSLLRIGARRFFASPCTMNDVFLRITESHSISKAKDQKRQTIPYTLRPSDVTFERESKVSWTRKVRILMKKEIIDMKRNWLVHFMAIIWEIFIITFIVMASEWRMPTKALPLMTLSLSIYGGEVIYEKSDLPNIDQSFEEIVREMQSKVRSVDSVKEVAEMDRSRSEKAKFSYTHWVAANLRSQTSPDGLTIGVPYYSLVGTFSPIVVINLLSNTMLRANGRRGSRITVNQHPFHYEKFLIIGERFGPSLWSELMVVVIALWLTVFGISSFREITQKSFLLQRMSGATSLQYWGSRFICHITLHAVLSCILLVTTITGGVNMFSCPSAAGAIFVIWLLYGLAGIPFIYLLLHHFATLGEMVKCLIQIIVAINIFYDFAMRFSQLHYAYDLVIKHFLFLIPTCNAKVALLELFKRIIDDSRCRLQIPDDCPIGFNNRSLQQRECMMPRSYLASVWENAFSLLWTAGLYLAIVIWLDSDYMWLRRMQKSMKAAHMQSLGARKMSEENKVHEDSDVMKERIRAQIEFAQMESRPRGYHFVLPPPNMIVTNEVQLNVGGKKQKLAAGSGGGISVRVKSGSCLGLLGADRSDRSVLLSLLSGLAKPTAGDIAGIVCKLSQNRKRYIANISYIGEFYGLIGHMTGHEMLELICNLKGETSENFQIKWNGFLGLGRILEARCSELSLGRQRLLSIALAMVGEPSVLLLNMPTAIMDPRTRRRVSITFNEYMRTNRSIVLTTNCLSDINTVCTHMACVHFGQVLCIGTPLYIRNRYRMGYVVIFEVDSIEDDLKSIRQAMRNQFKGKSKCAQVDRSKVIFVIQDGRMALDVLIDHLEEVCSTVSGALTYIYRDISVLHMLTEGVMQTRSSATKSRARGRFKTKSKEQKP